MFVVDGADRVRVDEARFELHELIAERHLRRVPLIVVANKQDAEGRWPRRWFLEGAQHKATSSKPIELKLSIESIK